MAGKEFYCFMHNIIFDTQELYVKHQEICENQWEQQCVCTQHADDGTMCGYIGDTLDALKDHSLERHRVYICDLCDAQSTEPLIGHNHQLKDGNVHLSKYKRLEVSDLDNSKRFLF